MCIGVMLSNKMDEISIVNSINDMNRNSNLE